MNQHKWGIFLRVVDAGTRRTTGSMACDSNGYEVSFQTFQMKDISVRKKFRESNPSP